MAGVAAPGRRARRPRARRRREGAGGVGVGAPGRRRPRRRARRQHAAHGGSATKGRAGRQRGRRRPPAPSSDDGAGVEFSGSGFFAAAEEKPGCPAIFCARREEEAGARAAAGALLAAARFFAARRRRGEREAPVLVPAPARASALVRRRGGARGGGHGARCRGSSDSARGLSTPCSGALRALAHASTPTQSPTLVAASEPHRAGTQFGAVARLAAADAPPSARPRSYLRRSTAASAPHCYPSSAPLSRRGTEPHARRVAPPTWTSQSLLLTPPLRRAEPRTAQSSPPVLSTQNQT